MIRRAPLSTIRAIRELSRHPLRTALAFLGLVAGVSSVIMVLAIAEGAGIERQRQLAERGANAIVIQGPTPDVLAELREQDRVTGSPGPRGLTMDDVDRLQHAIPAVAAITPMRESWGRIRYRDQEVDGRLIEVQPGYFSLTRQQLEQGRWLTENDASSHRHVAVIGHGIARTLFAGRNPIGESIAFHEIIDETPSQSATTAQPPRMSTAYLIVGVTTSGKGTPTAGRDQDLRNYAEDMAILLGTEGSGSNAEARTSWPRHTELTQITVTVNNVENVRTIAIAIDETLKQSHPPGDYAISVSDALLVEANAARRSQDLFLATVAATMLTIGGVGIMTIMLASVSERTREIGLRRAMGARRRDIIEQFVFEAGVICCLGAGIGVLAGLTLLTVYVMLSGIPVLVRPWAPVVAYGFAVTIGVLFGVYPAVRAARIEPADALRWSD